MQTLSQLLYVVSTALLVPVMVLMIGLLLWTLLLWGGFFREWLGRPRVRRALREGVRAGRDGNPWAALDRAPGGIPARFLSYVGPSRSDRAACAKAIADVDHRISESIAALSFITRVGPMLGLMGTLIPLGPALMGLAAGNMQELSSNLIVAFTTTVVGLLVSGLAYGMGLVRRLWYARDMNDLQFVVDRMPLPEAR